MVNHILKFILLSPRQKLYVFFFSVVTQRDWGLRQFDFSTAYLNAPLDEETYAYPRIGVEDPKGRGRIWRLLKSLYGAKQSARNGNSLLATLLR